MTKQYYLEHMGAYRSG